MKIKKNITKQEIVMFCKGQFYSDDKGTPWEPFEHYPRETLKEFARDMADNLESFLKDGDIGCDHAIAKHGKCAFCKVSMDS